MNKTLLILLSVGRCQPKSAQSAVEIKKMTNALNHMSTEIQISRMENTRNHEMLLKRLKKLEEQSNTRNSRNFIDDTIRGQTVMVAQVLLLEV